MAVYRADPPLNEHPLMRPWTRLRYWAIDSAGAFEGILFDTPVARGLAEQILDQIAHLGVRRRDRLGGTLHEYQHAA